jgi:ParB-like nuclease domain
MNGHADIYYLPLDAIQDDDRYQPYPNMAPDEFESLLASMQSGFWPTHPILVDEDKHILCGHMRYKAARHLGLEQVPVQILSGLSEAQKMCSSRQRRSGSAARRGHIDSELSGQLDLSLPTPYVSGYDYAVSDQAFHLEVWCEKSGRRMLLPICEQLGANYVTWLGYLSLRRTTELIQRVIDRGKPCRVFYVSDFDPAGDGMPVSIARQLQWLACEDAPDAEIKLTPIALSADQALPRTPIKDSDLRKGAFETRHGEGATELDALEALYPGELARLVTAVLEPYVDRTLPRRLARQRLAAQDAADESWAEHTWDLEAVRQTLEAEISAVVEPFAVELEGLANRLDAALAAFASRLKELHVAVQQGIDALDPVLPDRPEAEIEVTDEGDWLFDSGRGYFEQKVYYHQHRRGALA